MDKTLHIAFGLDANYIMQCGIALTSVCENNREEKLFFHLLALCEQEELNRFSPLTDIIANYHQDGEIIPIGEKCFEGLPELSYISKATYLRLLLPKVVSEDVKDILYLDSDIVVLGSLHYFLEHPLNSDHACGAAIDVNGCTIKHHNRIGIPSPVTYYNAGILQMNLAYWRKHNVSQEAINRIAENQYWFMDQDAINVVLNNKFARIPYQYNLQTSHYLYPPSQQELDAAFHQELYDAMESPIIVHYASYRKPWQKKCPRQELWLQYKRKTIWADVPQLESRPNDDTTQEWINKAKTHGNDLVNQYAPRFFQMIEQMSTSRSKAKRGRRILSLLSLFMFLAGFKKHEA